LIDLHLFRILHCEPFIYDTTGPPKLVSDYIRDQLPVPNTRLKVENRD